MLAPSKTFSRSSRPVGTRANLRASSGDGAAFGAMVGIGETFFAAFALSVGLGEVASGLVASLPLLAGGLLQLISPRAVLLVGSEKRWVVGCAALQSLTFIPLVVAAAYGSISLGALLLIASLYWACGLASGPAWNTWMQSVVPSRLRANYFASRTRASQLTTFVSFVAGGLVLEWARGSGSELVAFALLFGGAAAFRMLSVVYLTRHHSLIDPHRRDGQTRWRGGEAAGLTAELDASLASIDDIAPLGRRLLAYLVVMQGMVQIAGPYFAPFMLEKLQYSYGHFVALLAVAFAAKAIAFPIWASLARRRSAGWLLWVGGCGIIPGSILWVVSQNFFWLIGVQIVSGALWAAYELGFFLLFFEMLPIRQRTRMLTLYNFANTLAWCGGSLVGAGILAYCGASHGAYMLLFALSSLGRGAAVVLLIRAVPLRTPLWAPVPLRSTVRTFSIRVLGLRANGGGVDIPILPGPPAPAAAERFAAGASTAADAPRLPGAFSADGLEGADGFEGCAAQAA